MIILFTSAFSLTVSRSGYVRCEAPAPQGGHTATTLTYGLYGLTKIAVKDVGMNWEDVKRSTRLQREAARRYLLKMYKIFKNWDLAIQAYHLGPGNVKKGKRAYTYLRKVKSYAGV